MAQLDERLTNLVEALLRSPLAPLVTGALARIDSAEAWRQALGEDHDRFAPRPDETPKDRAFRQLELLDEVIAGRIKLELGLLERSLALSRELSAGLGDTSDERFATIMVVDQRAAPEMLEDVSREENLLSGARRERAQRFLEAWRAAVQVTRSSLEISPGL